MERGGILGEADLGEIAKITVGEDPETAEWAAMAASTPAPAGEPESLSLPASRAATAGGPEVIGAGAASLPIHTPHTRSSKGILTSFMTGISGRLKDRGGRVYISISHGTTRDAYAHTSQHRKLTDLGGNQSNGIRWTR